MAVARHDNNTRTVFRCRQGYIDKGPLNGSKAFSPHLSIARSNVLLMSILIKLLFCVFYMQTISGSLITSSHWQKSGCEGFMIIEAPELQIEAVRSNCSLRGWRRFH
jgi:hypothetical protein